MPEPPPDSTPPVQNGPSPDLETKSVISTEGELPSTTELLPAFDVPDKIGRYQVLRPIGRGGMGFVFLAEDTQLERKVALKIPRFSSSDHPDALERFYREARTAGRLQHPNVCPVYDVNEADGFHYLSMAYVQGKPLSDFVANYASKPPVKSAQLIRTIALALEEAHRQGIIHRDLKPSNVMIDQRGEPIVMDFGLARILNIEEKHGTVQGMVMGTPHYMPPEQARGDVNAHGPSSDTYSLGVILYELLTGRVPFDGPTMEVLAHQLRDDPPPPTQLRPDLDSTIEAICLKAMAKVPSERFLSMAEFAERLEQYVVEGPGPQQETRKDSPFGSMAAATLVILRTFGWETGIEKVRAQFRKDAESSAETALFLRWLSGDEKAHREAESQLTSMPFLTQLQGWAKLGLVFDANRDHRFDQVEVLLKEAWERADEQDNVLRAILHQQVGFFNHHVGCPEESLRHLHYALDFCGREHYLTGSVLETLSMVHTKNKNNFQVARELLVHSIASKRRFADQPALAQAHFRLGRLYLKWDELDLSEQSFQEALHLAQRAQDERRVYGTYGYLGQVELARAGNEMALGQPHSVRKHLEQAAQWLDAVLAAPESAVRIPDVAYTHKDRAGVCLAQNQLAEAEQHLQKAEAIFEDLKHQRGLAHARRVKGVLLRKQEKFSESLKALHFSLDYFDRTVNVHEAALVQLEIARTTQKTVQVPLLATRAYLDALRRAETSRRSALVRIVENELRAVDEQAHALHVFQRVRGKLPLTDTSTLAEGDTEVASVIFLNLEGFVAFSRGKEPREVLQTLNGMMAELEVVLDRFNAHVTTYLGGGFVALVRGLQHADRAVEAALELTKVMDRFNRPRPVLGLPQLPVSIGVASGNVFLGNIGTYQRMDFTAIGSPVSLAGRLMRSAQNQAPCISTETRELIGDQFQVSDTSPRTVDLKGFGRVEVWDVLWRKPEQSIPSTPTY